VAAVDSAATFGKDRDLAAWLGLVPRQATTGGKPRLLGITKRGSRYLHKMLIQGARNRGGPHVFEPSRRGQKRTLSVAAAPW
jgi:transposase